MSPYHYPIIELVQLSNNYVCSISKVEWWLLKYSELYETAKCECGSHFLYHAEQKGEEGINRFRQLFDKLTEKADIHKYESFCKNLLEEYSLIKHDLGKVEKWMRQHENFYDEYEFDILFEMENEDSFEINNQLSHLKTYKIDDKDMLLNHVDFEHILDFMKLFYHLFWIDKLLPDRIKAIEDDIKRSEEMSV